MPKMDLNHNPVPKKVKHNYPISKIHENQAIKYECWGESKSIMDWLKDPRVIPDLKVLTVWNRITSLKWTVEKALTTKPQNHRREEGKVKVRTSFKVKKNLVTAWGESKTVKEWAKLDICQVTPLTLWRRIKSGWGPEEAISSPPYRISKEVMNSLKEKTLGEIIRESAAIKRGMKKTHREEELNYRLKKSQTAKITITIVKKEDGKITASARSRWGVGELTIDEDLMPESFEGDDYLFEIRRTVRRKGKNPSHVKDENQMVREAITREREKPFLTKGDNLSKFDS